MSTCRHADSVQRRACVSRFCFACFLARVAVAVRLDDARGYRREQSRENDSVADPVAEQPEHNIDYLHDLERMKSYVASASNGQVKKEEAGPTPGKEFTVLASFAEGTRSANALTTASSSARAGKVAPALELAIEPHPLPLVDIPGGGLGDQASTVSASAAPRAAESIYQVVGELQSRVPAAIGDESVIGGAGGAIINANEIPSVSALANVSTSMQQSANASKQNSTVKAEQIFPTNDKTSGIVKPIPSTTPSQAKATATLGVNSSTTMRTASVERERKLTSEGEDMTLEPPKGDDTAPFRIAYCRRSVIRASHVLDHLEHDCGTAKTRKATALATRRKKQARMFVDELVAKLKAAGGDLLRGSSLLEKASMEETAEGSPTEKGDLREAFLTLKGSLWDQANPGRLIVQSATESATALRKRLRAYQASRKGGEALLKKMKHASFKNNKTSEVKAKLRSVAVGDTCHHKLMTRSWLKQEISEKCPDTNTFPWASLIELERSVETEVGAAAKARKSASRGAGKRHSNKRRKHQKAASRNQRHLRRHHDYPRDSFEDDSENLEDDPETVSDYWSESRSWSDEDEVLHPALSDFDQYNDSGPHRNRGSDYQSDSDDGVRGPMRDSGDLNVDVWTPSDINTMVREEGEGVPTPNNAGARIEWVLTSHDDGKGATPVPSPMPPTPSPSPMPTQAPTIEPTPQKFPEAVPPTDMQTTTQRGASDDTTSEDHTSTTSTTPPDGVTTTGVILTRRDANPGGRGPGGADPSAGGHGPSVGEGEHGPTVGEGEHGPSVGEGEHGPSVGEGEHAPTGADHSKMRGGEKSAGADKKPGERSGGGDKKSGERSGGGDKKSGERSAGGDKKPGGRSPRGAHRAAAHEGSLAANHAKESSSRLGYEGLLRAALDRLRVDGLQEKRIRLKLQNLDSQGDRNNDELWDAAIAEDPDMCAASSCDAECSDVQDEQTQRSSCRSRILIQHEAKTLKQAIASVNKNCHEQCCCTMMEFEREASPNLTSALTASEVMENAAEFPALTSMTTGDLLSQLQKLKAKQKAHRSSTLSRHGRVRRHRARRRRWPRSKARHKRLRQSEALALLAMDDELLEGKNINREELEALEKKRVTLLQEFLALTDTSDSKKPKRARGKGIAGRKVDDYDQNNLALLDTPIKAKPTRLTQKKGPVEKESAEWCQLRGYLLEEIESDLRGRCPQAVIDEPSLEPGLENSASAEQCSSRETKFERLLNHLSGRCDECPEVIAGRCDEKCAGRSLDGVDFVSPCRSLVLSVALDGPQSAELETAICDVNRLCAPQCSCSIQDFQGNRSVDLTAEAMKSHDLAADTTTAPVATTPAPPTDSTSADSTTEITAVTNSSATTHSSTTSTTTVVTTSNTSTTSTTKVLTTSTTKPVTTLSTTVSNTTITSKVPKDLVLQDPTTEAATPPFPDETSSSMEATTSGTMATTTLTTAPATATMTTPTTAPTTVSTTTPTKALHNT
eukprot:TRINITY_DN3429_c0_g1_i6.p1 TRINITY_DN3429_c0_g1~~TRINITY_DN3429_c0_g1_i6.p1  ORF type:complete len:1481 (-),score=257.98 TRINITY_DN3429_c0_g1_i6:107-4549(-)